MKFFQTIKTSIKHLIKHWDTITLSAVTGALGTLGRNNITIIAAAMVGFGAFLVP